jgi:hypothetical protein
MTYSNGTLVRPIAVGPGQAEPSDAVYDWLSLSSLGTLTVEVILHRWAGDSIPGIARRLGVSTSTVRRQLKVFLAWAEPPPGQRHRASGHGRQPAGHRL